MQPLGGFESLAYGELVVFFWTVTDRSRSDERVATRGGYAGIGPKHNDGHAGQAFGDDDPISGCGPDFVDHHQPDHRHADVDTAAGRVGPAAPISFARTVRSA